MRCINADELMMKDLGDGTCLITEESILRARTFEAEPVRHGYWTNVFLNDGELTVCKCSECGVEITIDSPNYCPKCGAKMDGDKENKNESSR